MRGHYLGLFRHAKSMLMAEHPASDVSHVCRETLRKEPGEEDESKRYR